MSVRAASQKISRVAIEFLSGMMSGPVNARVYHIKTRTVKKDFSSARQ
jgi:hypothetical protein